MEQEPRRPDTDPWYTTAQGGAPAARPPPEPPGARSTGSRLTPLFEAPVAAGLVAVNVVVLAGVYLRFQDPTGTEALVAAGALERGLLGAGEWWRLLTAVFLHIGWVHLAANSIFGFGWCRMVEKVFGHGRFLLLYLLAGLGASAASMATHDVVGAGASGALFGMIGATLVIHRRLLPGWGPFLRSRSTLSVATQLGLWTVLAISANLPIDHAAHFGGLLTGAAAAWIMTRPFPRRPIAWVPFALIVGAVVAVAVWPRPGLSQYAIEQSVQRALGALDRDDVATVAMELRSLDDAGVRSDQVELIRAVVALGHDDLATAAAIAQRLLETSGFAGVRHDARAVLFNVGYRFYRGVGVAADAERGYGHIRAACKAGLEEACRAERQIRTGEGPLAPRESGR